MLHAFYIYDRHCTCVYLRQFSVVSDGTVNSDNESDIAKLLFGVLYSLKNLSSKLGDLNDQYNQLNSFSSSIFRVHYLETLTNLKFVLITDPSVDNLQSVLWELYSHYYLNNIVYNPLLPVDFKPEQKINNVNFINQTDQFLRSLSI